MTAPTSHPPTIQEENEGDEVAHENCRLEFVFGGKTLKLQTQEHLEEYLKMPNRPQLCVIKPKKSK